MCITDRNLLAEKCCLYNGQTAKYVLCLCVYMMDRHQDKLVQGLYALWPARSGLFDHFCVLNEANVHSIAGVGEEL